FARPPLRAVFFFAAGVDERFAAVFFFPAGFAFPPPAARLGRAGFGEAGCSGEAGSGVAATCTGRSATCTVRCAVRLTTRNARPIGAGRIRFCEGPWLA